MKIRNLFTILLSTFILAGCGNNPATHEHTFSDKWSSNEISHWHAATCEHTDIKKDDAPHVMSDGKVCDICGFTHQHQFSGFYDHDDYYHWHSCYCGEKTDYRKHNYVNGVCTECYFEAFSPTTLITINGVTKSAEQYKVKGSENVYQLTDFYVNDTATISFAYKTIDSTTPYTNLTFKANDYGIKCTGGSVWVPIYGYYTLKFDFSEGIMSGELVEFEPSSESNYSRYHYRDGVPFSNGILMKWNRVNAAENYFEVISQDYKYEELNTMEFSMKFTKIIDYKVIGFIKLDSVTSNVPNSFVILDDKESIKYTGTSNELTLRTYLRFNLDDMKVAVHVEVSDSK